MEENHAKRGKRPDFLSNKTLVQPPTLNALARYHPRGRIYESASASAGGDDQVVGRYTQIEEHGLLFFVIFTLRLWPFCLCALG